jgi:tRNA-dihydrouridine synthase B
MKRKLISLKPKNKIFLAPMEEVCDIVFRLLCKKQGAGLTWTPLTNPQTKQVQHLFDKPVLQLFCTTTKGIKEFMKKYEEKVCAWDFNLGCPAKTAKKHGFGAYLTDLELIEKILKEMRKNTKKPLIVKIRKSPLSFKILKIAEKYCDYIAIHPRTKEQGYSGEPDLKFALKFKKKSTLPVIYSGNVDYENSKKLLKKFDFVMIGRKAIGNPCEFNNSSKKLTFQDYLNLYQKLNKEKKVQFYFRQIKFQAMCFTKGIEGSAKIRLELSTCKNLNEIKDVLEKFNPLFPL